MLVVVDGKLNQTGDLANVFMVIGNVRESSRVFPHARFGFSDYLAKKAEFDDDSGPRSL